MATAALSPTLRSRIEQVARRIRLTRVVRGVSLLVLLLAVTGGLALLADFLFDLPAVVRMGLATAWFGLGAACLASGVFAPLTRRLDPAALAALVEEKYPDLGERLTTSVELAENDDAYHGSPELIALLLKETERRTYQLPFLSAVPTRYAAVLAACAAAALFLVAAPAAVAPQEYGRLAKRFLLAYVKTAEPAPYRIEVNPGDVVTAQGKTVKVSIHLVPQKENVKLPGTSTLVLIDANGKETSQRMVADNPDAFSAEVKVIASGSYRIETKDVTSDTFAVTSVVPVELAAESPKVVVELPEYARATVETPEPTYGLDDLTLLQHGQVTFAFRFTRPAVNAFIEWTPGAKNEVGGLKLKAASQPLPLLLAKDRMSGTWTLPAETGGAYGLVLEAEHGIRTTLAARAITVQEDKEPEVLRFTGKEDLRTVLPYDTIPIDVQAVDDIGVARVVVEYRVKDGEMVAEEVPVERSRDVNARYGFKLAGKVKAGDEVTYRIRVEDNLPEEFNGPHTVYYPADRWLRLKIVKQASSLSEQEILAQKKDVADRLERIKADLKKEDRLIYKVHEESKHDAALRQEHVQEVKQLRDENKATASAMQQLVRELVATPALRPLADRIEDVADTEVKRSQDALEKVDPKKPALERNKDLQVADHNVMLALQRLEELKTLNDRLAQDRIDQNKVEMLAEREKKLAQEAAELAAKDPVRDPTAKEQAETIKKEQAEVAAELQALTDQSEKLRNALQEDAAEQARKAAERAKELAEAQRELNKAAAETEQQRNAEKLSELAKKQAELAEKAEKLAQETRQPAQAAKTNPLKPEEARAAADELKKGDPNEALKHQDKTAQDLDRLANALDKAIDLAKDPREAARQLARLEEGLKKKVDEEAKKPDAKQPLADRLKPLQAEQQAIQQAAERLSVPPQNPNVLKEKQEAVKQAEQAVASLAKKDTTNAVAQMELAQNKLERLAEQLPNLNERRQQAQRELDKLRQKQDEVGRQTQKAIDQARQNKDEKKAKDELNKQLAEAAHKQAEVAEDLAKMDAPNQEARQEKTREALDRALADLLDARKQDVPASQQVAKRELERLQQALNGQEPADDPAAASKHTAAKPKEQTPQQAAREMARQQRDLAKATQKAQEDAGRQGGEAGKQAMEKALQKVAEQQKELNEQTSQLPAKQAEKGLEQARAAMNQAKQSLERNDPAQAKQKQDEAANALDRLAQALPKEQPKTFQKDADAGEPKAGLPTKEQTGQARALAKEQRDLRDAVKRAQDNANAQNTPQENPVGELAKQQQEVAKQAADLAKNVNQEQGEKSQTGAQARQAKQNAKQTANQVQAGDLNKAQQSGKQTAEQLRKLAQDLAQTPRGKNADADAPDPVQQARDLAKKQEDLNGQMEPLKENNDAKHTQQTAQQDNLQKQTNDLKETLDKIAKQMQKTPQAQQSASQASQSCKECETAQQVAKDSSKQGNQGASQKAGSQAADALERAAQQANQAAQQQAAAVQQANAGKPKPPQDAKANQQAGEAVNEAKDQVGKAQGQLDKGQNQGAKASMAKAADALAKAAEQMAQQGKPGEPTGKPGKPGQPGPSDQGIESTGGAPDLTPYGPDAQKFAGKSWGELPGELKTRIVQDMKAKYGEDYTKIIKLYFEQIADTKKGK